MFWNKEYTTKGDKILDNETGDELDINTNKLADKSGIKADLGQGESPFEVEVTPKKDVKEKFAKAFKKALMVGTVTLFTAGLIYGGAQVKDVYDDYSQYYKGYKQGVENEFSEYQTAEWFDDVAEEYGVVEFHDAPRMMSEHQKDVEFLKDTIESITAYNQAYSQFIKSAGDIKALQKGKQFDELSDVRKQMIKDMDTIYTDTYIHSMIGHNEIGLKKYEYEIKKYEIELANGNGYDSFYYYSKKLEAIGITPENIYTLTPLEIKQAERKLDKLKAEMKIINKNLDNYIENSDSRKKLEVDFEARINEVNQSIEKDISSKSSKDDSEVIVQELKPLEDCEGKKIQIKTENKDIEEFVINSIEDLENAPNVEKVEDLGDGKHEIKIKGLGAGELER